MIKKSIKNYFVSLKHFFTPIGTLFLGIVLGCTAFLYGIVPAISTVINDVNALSSDVSLNFKSLADSVLKIVNELDWSEPSAALSTILTKDWQSATLTECINSLLGVNYEVYINNITDIVMTFVNTIAALWVVFFVFVLIGIIGGYYLTKFLVRRTIAKRAWWKFFLVAVLNSVFSVGLIFACVLLVGVWSPSIFITSIVYLLLFGATSLFEAYFTYAYKKVNLTEILNIKNACFLVASNAIVMLIAIVLTVIAFLLFNVLMGLVLGLPLMEIAMLTTSMNAESYVKGYVEKKNAEKQPADAISETDT